MFDSIQQSAWHVFDKRIKLQTQQDAFDRLQAYSGRTDSVLSEQTLFHQIPNDCSMDFVLVGIAHGLGYATLTIYMT